MANWPLAVALSLPPLIKPEIEPPRTPFHTALLSPCARTATRRIRPPRHGRPMKKLVAAAGPGRAPKPPSSSRSAAGASRRRAPSLVDRTELHKSPPPSSSTSGRRRRSPPPPLPQCPSRLQLVAVVVSKFPLASFYFSPNRSPCLRAPPPAAPPPRGASRHGRQSRLPKPLGEFVSLPSSRRA
jgi:hypothetical protein